MKRIKLWLFDSEYRTLLKRRKNLVKQDRVFESTLERTVELYYRNSNRTEASKQQLNRLRTQVIEGMTNNLQLLHEVDVELKRKLGVDECDNG